MMKKEKMIENKGKNKEEVVACIKRLNDKNKEFQSMTKEEKVEQLQGLIDSYSALLTIQKSYNPTTSIDYYLGPLNVQNDSIPTEMIYDRILYYLCELDNIVPGVYKERMGGERAK